MKKYLLMIKEICEEEEIDIKSFSDDWTHVLTKDNIQRRINGYAFELNNAASSNICDDKTVTSEILIDSNIPCILHEFFFNYNENLKSPREDIIKCFEKYGKVVIKPNKGHSGKDVFLVQNADDLNEKIDYLFQKYQDIVISPYYDIETEYRIIILDNEAKIVYGKNRTKDWRFNLSHGATADIDVSENLQAKLSSLAIKTAKVLNIRFASVDIAKIGTDLIVLEVNKGVSMERFSNQSAEYYKIAKEIYREAILKMFM